MTKITINGVKVIDRDIENVKSLSFDYLGEKVYSGEKVQKMFGVFVSQTVVGDSGLLSWKEMSWSAQKPIGTDIFLYVKSASSEDGLDKAIWRGPFLNSTTDISDFDGRYLQFIVILENYGEARSRNYDNVEVADSPVFESISLSYLSADNASKFYTKTFDLGFAPKHVLLTYNGDVSADSVVRFAISGFDSVDPSDYQYIDPNKIELLSELSILSNKIKLLIEMIGDNDVTVTIDEFALMFSGEEQLRLNKISSSSSESSSSSDSSESVENTSSSSSSS